MILAIDPGNEYSAYVIVTNDLNEIIQKDKVLNDELLKVINEFGFDNRIDYVAIEMVASYGMAVGKTVFDTCVWIGRFYQAIYKQYSIEPMFIYRKDEKMCLCGNMKAKDSNIVQALIDRFAPYTPNKGKGTKKEQGFFYGFKKDIWQSFAVAVAFHDLYMDETVEV